MANVNVYRMVKWFNLWLYRSNQVILKPNRFNIRSSCYSTLNTTTDGVSTEKTIEDHFLNPHVQHILKKITGLNYEKIFEPMKQKLESPEYRFVTDKELQKLRKTAHCKALEKVQMPPVMQARKPINEIIAKNPEVQGCETHRLLCIDISLNTTERNRTIVVREPDGLLRQATWEERFRMNQIYFPTPGRKLTTPGFFEEDKLLDLLDREAYLFVLDSACVQFEPDDPDYIRVTHTSYNHINKRKKFDELRSTRHFGPMAFYLACNNKIEKLLTDMIERELIEDAGELIKLLCILHPEMKNNFNLDQNDVDLIREFIVKNTSMYKADMELAFQTLCEIQKQDVKSETVA